MRIYNRLTDKSKFLVKAIVFFYLIFSFYEWNFNPGDWDTFSRVAVVLLFGFATKVVS